MLDSRRVFKTICYPPALRKHGASYGGANANRKHTYIYGEREKEKERYKYICACVFMKKITCCTLLKMWANKCFTLLEGHAEKKQRKQSKPGEKNIAKCAHKAEKHKPNPASVLKPKPKAAGAPRRLPDHCPCHLACSAIRGLRPKLNPFMQRDFFHAHTHKLYINLAFFYALCCEPN